MRRLEAGQALGRECSAELSTLFSTCFDDYDVEEPPPPADWRWISELDGRIACHVAVRRAPNAAAPSLRIGHLAYVATPPALRRRGLAAALLRRVQEDAPLIGIEVLVLHAEPDATRLYERLGWLRIAPCARYVDEDRLDADPVYGWATRTEALVPLRTELYDFETDW